MLKLLYIVDVYKRQSEKREKNEEIAITYAKGLVNLIKDVYKRQL